jgi:hypothetical protein
MNKSITILAVIVATLVVSFAGRPVLAASIPSATAVVTVNVYVTVTDYGRVIRIPIEPDGGAGTLEIIFESDPDKPAEQRDLFGIDGIKVGPDGNFYIVVIRTDQLVAIRPGASTHSVIVDGHPLDGPTQLVFGLDNGVEPLPPLYIANGAERRAFLLGIASSLGGGSLLNGVAQLVDTRVITEEQAIGI